MKNMDNRELVGEVEESPFEVMSTGDAVDFSDYVDPRDWYYFESTLAENWEWTPESNVIENDEFDNNYYDDLENLYNNSREYDSYVRMKNYNVKSEWDLWSVSSATREEVSSALDNDKKDVAHTKTIKMNLADTLEFYKDAA